MAGLFVLALLIPWTRDFFALQLGDPWITASAVGIAAVAAALLEIGWGWTGWLRPDR
jgi:cation-transporting P-type ATPase E